MISNLTKSISFFKNLQALRKAPDPLGRAIKEFNTLITAQDYIYYTGSCKTRTLKEPGTDKDGPFITGKFNVLSCNRKIWVTGCKYQAAHYASDGKEPVIFIVKSGKEATCSSSTASEEAFPGSYLPHGGTVVAIHAVSQKFLDFRAQPKSLFNQIKTAYQMTVNKTPDAE